MTAVIDCDTHPVPASEDELLPYLSSEAREAVSRYAGRRYRGCNYPRENHEGARADSWPAGGGPPGSDLATFQEQLLDRWEISRAILNPVVPAGILQPDVDVALCSAVNDWTGDRWLDRDDRLRGSVLVPYEQPEASAREVHRVLRDPRFVQVYLYSRTNLPLGNRHYWPIYAAACEHDVPVCLHFGGRSPNPITGTGWPSYYLEEHVGMAQIFQAQMISLVCEGVFDAFPSLKFVLLEGGVAWMPPLAWRLDRARELFGEDLSHLKRTPSEYLAEHVRMATQPNEEPPKQAHYQSLFKWFPLEDMLVFSTDYPHWDFDAPKGSIQRWGLSREVRDKILFGNAERLYRF